MTQKTITFRLGRNDPGMAYVGLPDHPGEGSPGCVKKQIRLSEILAYQGPDIFLDIDAAGRLIGIEILG